jgi:multiple sugar transport system substrate-binding protein
MKEIELSVRSYTPARVEELARVLAEFEAQNRVKVVITTLAWESSWSEILKFAFHGYGPAVSEVGDTWVNSLSKMNALRAFSQAEIDKMGGKDGFLPATWRRELVSSEGAWSMPWLAETRVLHYRRDLLEAAGVDEATAFESYERLVETLEKLQESGVASPWIVPTTRTLNTLHTIPNWIWSAGGDFVDPDYRRIAIADSEAVAGLARYYSLHRFIDPQYFGLDADEVDAMFMSGNSAVTINGPWAIFPTYDVTHPDILEKVGVARLPGEACVLASNLVVWKHATVREEALAVKLVKYLTEHDPQRACGLQTGLLPARLETLEMEPYSDQPAYQVFVEGLKSGRSLPTMRLWGLIEERLTFAFGNIWEEVLAEPNGDITAIIQGELEPLARRLNRNL